VIDLRQVESQRMGGVMQASMCARPIVGLTDEPFPFPPFSTDHAARIPPGGVSAFAR
jgi:hypothetical protein